MGFKSYRVARQRIGYTCKYANTPLLFHFAEPDFVRNCGCR
jgi:hypothetical protein